MLYGTYTYTYEMEVAMIRTARLEARISPEALAIVRRAAELQGRSVSDFVVAAAQEAERLSLNQYRLGTVPYTTVVQTQTAALSAEQSLLSIRLNRLTASANLVLALGGGWRDTDLPAPYPIGGLDQKPQPPMPTPQSLAPERPWWRFW